MRRAQSVRHYARPSVALAADDLGVLREGDESNEDVLRKQLLEKDRECDRLQMTIQALQDQLAQRPPLETIQDLQKDYKNLELILLGTQRENEKSMANIEQAKQRERLLERELTRLAGDNWRTNLEIPSTSAAPPRSGVNLTHQRSNTISSPISRYSPGPSPRPDSFGPPSHNPYHHPNNSSPSPSSRPLRAESPSPTPLHENVEAKKEKEAQRVAALAQIEQMRMFILGMDQRLDLREQKLAKTVERAESEGRKYEEAASQAAAIKI